MRERVRSNIMADEVEVVSWSDGHSGPSPLGQPGVGLVEGLVDVDKGIDTGLAVGGGSWEVRVRQGNHVWSHVL